jgi:protein TonB
MNTNQCNRTSDSRVYSSVGPAIGRTMFDRSPLEHCLLENPQNSWRDTNKYSGPLSLALHGVAVALLLLAGRVVTVTDRPTLISRHDVLVAPPIASYIRALTGGGGGGDRSLTPASAGRAPRFEIEPLAPAMAVIRAIDPKLEVQPALAGPPEIQLPKSNLPMWGDPNGTGKSLSNGRGGGGGIGDGDGTGIGPGKGSGLGPGEGSGFTYHPGAGGVTVPKVIYSVEPEFTDAARQAKHQGSVLIGIIVDAEGRVRDPKVINALGMGLDEKALAAVQQWKFKPGLKDGHAVPVYAQVLVTFRLL